MNELEKIRKRAGVVLGDVPSRRKECAKKLQAAENDLQKAREEQDASESMEEYDAAAETVKRAEMNVRFARQALKKIDAAPRMDEAEYSAAVDKCQHLMIQAVIDYRSAAEKLMGQLLAAYNKYLGTAHDVNETLIELDDAANILQLQYKDRVITCQDAPEVRWPDKNEWLNHAVRYPDNVAYRLAVESDDDARLTDSVLGNAWAAVVKGYPKRSY